MLTSQENEILTQVGPATPMGRMMRRFWLPVCTSAQLPEADSDPLRAGLLTQTASAFGAVQIALSFFINTYRPRPA